jgi:ATP-dependent helicase Lhr and Lhr-like helicase
MLPEAMLNEVGGLDQQAIARVREEARPDVRDSDELHDTLQTLVALPLEIPDEDWQQAITNWMPRAAELLEGWRAARAQVGDRRYLVASERAKDFLLIFPDAKFEVIRQTCHRTRPRATMPCSP